LPKSSVREEKGKSTKGECFRGNYHIFSLLSDIVLGFPIKPGGDDPSTKIWFLSVSHADRFDAAIADIWKADMDGILVYVRSNS
jgi:hypothetical protein